MNHDDEHELFRRLEADLNTPAGAEVVDLDKARAAREDATAVAPTPDADADRDETAEPVLVDGPAPTGPGLMERVRGAQRAPILPAWVCSKPEFMNAAGWLAGYAGHTAAFHTVRAPYYAAALAVRAPAGAARFVGGSLRWLRDAEGEHLRQAAARREHPEDYLKLSRQRDNRVRLRGLLFTLACLVGPIVALSLWVLAPAWLLAASAAAVTLALGWYGAPADRPVVSRAVVATEVERLTSSIVERALGALGIAEVNKALGKGGEGIKFPAPITRDGPGWRADVDLPYGVTVTDILDRRDRLASGLRRPLGCVWPEPVPDEHAGRMMLWVGDRALSKVPPPAWPLAKSGSASLFEALPFGTDQRGRPVALTLMYDNLLIGAMPGMGKTFSLRTPLLAAALDPRAELLVWELKGTGDLDALSKVAADYGSGPDDETCAAALDSIRYVYGDLERRAKVIAGLPKDKCPENKVTPDLAKVPSLGLHPLVLSIDECQELFMHPELGKEAGALCTSIIKRGRALGVILLLATQRPDKDSLPTGISANVGSRFCLRVMGQTENDMVLGTSAYKSGTRATTFTKSDKGIGYLVGATDEPQIVRTYYLDNLDAERIAQRARAARIAAGTLSGAAAGEAPERSVGVDTLLDDLLAVVPASEAKCWNETAVDRLAQLRPELYETWAALDPGDKAAQLTNALKRHGIKTGQVGRRVDGKTVNRRGFERHHLTTAVAERDRKRPAG
ncbi:cell division protein FtsK [Streptomyces sp. 549]|uniref:cell division protein FtsK n=1 Tax=Streptomyces sp. 549 TaxID=3049076 RepID=UPI0024C37BC2|nr:cell division protein FtsK [Streptomyces sp. 549]MDK1474929.1 cell division protein FtsK [Streptomyces sp. 549]